MKCPNCDHEKIGWGYTVDYYTRGPKKGMAKPDNYRNRKYEDWMELDPEKKEFIDLDFSHEALNSNVDPGFPLRLCPECGVVFVAKHQLP